MVWCCFIHSCSIFGLGLLPLSFVAVCGYVAVSVFFAIIFSSLGFVFWVTSGQAGALRRRTSLATGPTQPGCLTQVRRDIGLATVTTTSGSLQPERQRSGSRAARFRSKQSASNSKPA